MGLRLQHKVLRSALPRPLRFLACVLALFAHDNGTDLFPRVNTIAEALGTHRTQVLRGLRALRQLGVLVVERPGGGRHRSTRYRFVAAALPQAQPRDEHVARDAHAPQPDKPNGSRVHAVLVNDRDIFDAAAFFSREETK
jgi:biotin operon repressor